MIDWKMIGWGVLFLGLAAIAASLDDTAEVRNIEVLPEPPRHIEIINYGNR